MDRMTSRIAHGDAGRAGGDDRRSCSARAASSTRSTSTTRSATTSSTSCTPRASRPRTGSRSWRCSSQYGASPRASIFLNLAARAHAFLRRRGYVTPEDIKAIGARRPAPPRHPDLRGRGGERHQRGHRPPTLRARRSPVAERARCCPRELIKKIRRIEIVTARQAQNQLAGAYHSVFKGRGMAFSEVRQYQPGDDVRAIDWNVTARMRDAVRQAVRRGARADGDAARRRHRGSGAFGSREQTKREVAAELAALLAFSAIKNNDRDRAHHLHRSGRALRAAEEGQEARAARDQRDPDVPADVAAHRSARRRSSFWARSRAAARSPSWSRTSSSTAARRALREGAAHRQAQARPRAGHHHRSDGGGAARRSVMSTSRMSRPARWSPSTRRGRGGRATRRGAARSRRARAAVPAAQHGLRQRAHRPALRRAR